MNENVRNYWQLLGTPAAISLPVALWFFPFGFIGPLSIDPQRLGGTTLQWFTIGVIAELFLILSFLTFNRVFPDSSSRLHPWRNLALLVGAILVRSLVLTFASLFFTSNFWGELTYRIVAGLTGPTPTILLVAITYASWVQQTSITRQLLRDTLELQHLEELSRRDNSEIRRDLLQEINLKIEPLLTQFHQALTALKLDQKLLSATSAAYQRLQDDISALRAHLLAPAQPSLVNKHEIDPTKSMLSRRFQWPKTLQMQRTMQPLVAVFLFGIPAVSQAIRGMPFASGLVFVVSISAIASAFIGVARSIFARVSLPTLFAVVLTGLVYGTAGLSATAVLQLIGLAPATSVISPAALVGFNLGAFVALYQAFSQRQENLNAELLSIDARLAQETASVRQNSWITRRRLELVLHGSMQSALHAAILRLTSTKEITSQTIDQIQQDIYASLADLNEKAGAPQDVPEALGQIKETWRGVCEVQDYVPAKFINETKSCQVLAQSAIEILREGVHNAAIHGDAKEVFISIYDSSAGWVIELKDDGRGPGRRERAGFGSRMLDEIASEWSLSRGPQGGAVLRVTLPSARAKTTGASARVEISDEALVKF